MNAHTIRHPTSVPSVEELAKEYRRLNPPARGAPFPESTEPWGWDAGEDGDPWSGMEGYGHGLGRTR
jgi:hypothetical protein